MPRTGSAPSSRAFKVGVWRSLMEVHNTVLREIEHELAERHRLSISEFDTLVNIPLKGTRLRELKDRVVLTQSAVSRLCDKLADRGLITRSPLEEDARGAMIHLTDAGRKVHRNAARTNAEVVERTFADRLSQTQLESLHEILAQLNTEHHPEGCDVTE
ncbi:MarR family winged helix-turn-helix transcriptional regulator [Streptomyces sp. NPDC048527]|uniref:MarR family winged helix-turn-helix transcriptional regulator n=1 Tax=Streptomyces sp. NPDC048527 TaxID=3365568 RepID=UPI00371CF091